MDKNEFIKLCVSSGYSSKNKATAYVEQNPKSIYTSDDFVEVSRMGEITHHSPLASGYIENGRKSTSSGFRS